MPLDADALLAAPRGRRLCLEAASACAGFPTELSTALFWADYWAHESNAVLISTGGSEAVPAPPPGASEIAGLMNAVDISDVRGVVAQALEETVDRASYWQHPDGHDEVAAGPQVGLALERVAVRIVELPETRWWSSPVALEDQWQVLFEGASAPDHRTPVHDRLARWVAATREEERRARHDRPSDATANWGGTWWSRPPSDLVTTSRALPGSGPVRLTLVEDRLGWMHATATQMRTPTSPRVCEIDGPDAWVELCRRHPLDVTASRRHEWYRTTGRDGRWVIPDWSAIGREYDGVHLSVAGYLTTAGRTLIVEDAAPSDPSSSAAATLLGGWDPDATYWFVDLPEVDGSFNEWRKREDGEWQRWAGRPHTVEHGETSRL
ncbi:hypothetical protein GCM10028798_13330 [Humibacter antri]